MSSQKFLSKSRLVTIFTLALPILATMLAQNLMSAIDTAMIGRLGDVALAAISVSSNQFFMLFSLLMGINTGVQAIVARRKGAGNHAAAPLILNAGIVVATVIGVIVVIVGYLTLPTLVRLINSDEAVIAQANSYLFYLLPGAIAGGISMAFGGFWVGISRPVFGLATIFVQLVCNALFNYAFIFGNFGMPRMDIAGAGLGTTLSNCVGLLVNIGIAIYVLGWQGLFAGLPSKAEIKTLLTISLPMSIQQFMFSVGMLVFVFIVGLLGTKELAAFQVIMVIMLTSLMMALGLGATATTLVGGALGKGDVEAAKQWGWEIATLGAGILLVVGGLSLFFAEPILTAFVTSPSTVALAQLPLQIMIVGIWLEAFGRILSMALVGAGAIATVFKITFTNQWLMRLPLYWVVGVSFQQGLVGIFTTMLICYIIQTSTFVWIWRRGNWNKIHI